MKKILLLVTATVMLFLNTGISLAADAINNSSNDLYNVEIIVFSYTHPNATSEMWPNITNIPDFSKTIDIQNTANDLSTTPNIPLYQQMPPQSWLLTKELRRLSSDSNYKIILHKSWVQPILKQPLDEAQTIHIVGGQNYGSDENPIWEMNGTLTLNKDIYFNVKTNLLLTQSKNDLPSSLTNIPQSPFGSDLSTFQLKNSDRMRSDQPCYFDHPLFGMLVSIHPAEK